MISNAQREPYTDVLDADTSAPATTVAAARLSVHAPPAPPETPGATAPPLSEGALAAAELRRIALERLAAHRSRRAGELPPAPPPPPTRTDLTPAAQRARDAVAARYRQAPSYQDYLNAPTPPPPAPSVRPDPPRPVAAAAPVVQASQQPIQPAPAFEPIVAAQAAAAPAVAPPAPVARVAETLPQREVPLQVRFEREIVVPEPPPVEALQVHPAPSTALEAQAGELQELDEEIAFRFDPEFHEHLLEPLPIQANIIEFPRQLVATKKARPRLAEGPLRELDAPVPTLDTEPLPAADEPQLRIFEVEPDAAPALNLHAAIEPIVETPSAPPWEEPAALSPDELEAQQRHEDKIRMMVELDELEASPEWQRLVLDARPEEDEAPSWVPAPKPEMPPAWKAIAEGRIELRVAPVELRLMAATVDALCILAAALLFLTVAALAMGTRMHGIGRSELLTLVGVTLVVLLVLYQWLFYSLVATTPGMFYADLVFRSLQDGDPTRSALRCRIFANLLAAAPLGLGYLWMLFDRDRLGWHDRLSGTYLREF